MAERPNLTGERGCDAAPTPPHPAAPQSLTVSQCDGRHPLGWVYAPGRARRCYECEPPPTDRRAAKYVSLTADLQETCEAVLFEYLPRQAGEVERYFDDEDGRAWLVIEAAGRTCHTPAREIVRRKEVERELIAAEADARQAIARKRVEERQTGGSGKLTAAVDAGQRETATLWSNETVKG